MVSRLALTLVYSTKGDYKDSNKNKNWNYGILDPSELYTKLNLYFKTLVLGSSIDALILILHSLYII